MPNMEVACVKFCDPHWQMLRTAIDDRGMGSLVADSGEEAIERIVAEVDRGTTVDTFEPLMGAHNAIMNHGLELIGLWAIQMEGCLLCFLNEQHAANCSDPACPKKDDPRAYDEWIDKAADLMLETWEGMKL